MENIYGFNHFQFFTDMSHLATQHNSFDLSLGLPDFGIDERLKGYLKESADYAYHNYEPLAGNPILIENIIRFNSKRKNPILPKREEITIVPCATFALYTALRSILNQGDEVIVIQPSYYTYAPAVVLNGGIPVYYDLEESFIIRWENFQSCITERTKAIIINSPQNPTGKTLSKDDWEQLYTLIKEKEIYLISEEIYDLYCYDTMEHYSSFIHQELKKRTFCIFSFGKMFHTTGWKVGYILASEELTARFRCHQQYISYSANAPAQYALAKFLEIFDHTAIREAMQNKRDLFNELIRGTPLQIEQKAEGSVFQLVNFRNVSQTMSDIEFSKWLTIEKKVACLPLSAFYNSKHNSDYIRFCFSKSDDLLIQALEHLRKNL